MKALILSGGGALGAFEAGAIQSLHDSGDEFDVVCGSSIGAINASFVAQDKIDQLTALWRRIGNLKPPLIDYMEQVNAAINLLDEIEKVVHLNPFGIAPAALRWMQVGSKKALMALRGFVKPDAIKEILSSNLEFTALKRSLIVTATNLTYGSSETFYAFVGPNCGQMQTSFTKAFGDGAHALSNDEEFILAIRASAAIPGAFEPVPMNLGSAGDKEFVDGGVANNTPIKLAADVGATEITAILLQPVQASAPAFATNNLLEIGLASLTVMQQKLLEQDMDSVNNNPAVTIRYIRPLTPLSLTVLGFNDQRGIDAAFEAGIAAAKTPKPLNKKQSA
jgi:predicted acylesterase/phospholipase RssA